MVVIQQPGAINYSGNLPDFVLESVSGTTVFQLFRDNAAVLTERYSPDPYGRVRIRLSDTIHRMLHTDLPDYNQTVFIHNDAYVSFVAEIDGNAYPFSVLKGFVQRKPFNVPFFLKFNWLTAQPKIKTVKFHDPEWLTCLPAEDVGVFIRATMEDGSTVTVPYASLQSGKLQSVKLNPGVVIGLFADEPIKWEVYTEFGGERRQYVQTYINSKQCDEYDDLFVFESRIGGVDTIRFTGIAQRSDGTVFENARFDEYTRDYFAEPSLTVTKETGYIGDKLVLFHALDFFRSARKHHVYSGDISSIYLLEPEIVNIKGELRSYSFRFGYSDVKSAYPDWALPPHLLDLP